MFRRRNYSDKAQPYDLTRRLLATLYTLVTERTSPNPPKAVPCIRAGVTSAEFSEFFGCVILVAIDVTVAH